MSPLNDAQKHGLETGEYPCPECGAMMEFEDKWRDTLVCSKCGYDVALDRYGYNDEEYEKLYPTKEEIFGYDDEEDEDEYNGEYYEEVYGELSDD